LNLIGILILLLIWQVEIDNRQLLENMLIMFKSCHKGINNHFPISEVLLKDFDKIHHNQLVLSIKNAKFLQSQINAEAEESPSFVMVQI